MTKGITLLAFGVKSYAYWAYNLAFTIKQINPSLDITIFHDGVLNNLPADEQAIFNSIQELPAELTASIDPCKIKLHAYEFLTYDINLLLDVDAITFQDLEILLNEFEESKEYYRSVAFDNMSSNNNGDELFWADIKKVWAHFDLKEDAILPATNTSVQLVRKCDESEKLFSTAKELYNNPLPLAELKHRWGGMQPDELYMNVALSKCELTLSTTNNIIFFGNKFDRRPMCEIVKAYFLIAFYGGRNYTRAIYTEWYDKHLNVLFRKSDKKHKYRYNTLMIGKHAEGSRGKIIQPVAKKINVPKELLLA